jgi:tetratricopeptide (TPR) repeat protein
VAGAFAPSVYDGVRERGARREAWQGSVESPPPQSWARLLDPRRELVGFVGRKEELAALAAWCQDEDAARLRIVTGPGGVGKTRLAVELAERLTKHGWTCERVADGKEGAAITALRAMTRGRALLVVDYAETRVGLKQMLTALAGDQGGGVRVLLLARSAGEWWDQLGVGEPAVWDVVQAAKAAELALPAVVAADLSDADVIALAVMSFARELGLPEKTVEIYGGNGTGRRRVLDLHAAALVAVLAEAGTETVRVDIGTVLGELLRHEQHLWYHSAQAAGLSEVPDGMSPLMLRQIVAAGCLLGATTEQEARALPGRVPWLSPSVRVATWLRNLYPPGSGEPDWLGSLQPDRLAELHTVRELVASPELSRACLSSLDSRQARRAVTLLARASSDNPDAEALLSKTLPEVADFIVGLDVPRETLTAIFNAIPYPTVILAPAAATLARQILGLLRADSEPAVRAYWLSVLGIRFWALGRPADALPVTEEAVVMYRGLAAASPDRYRPDLATSLSNLGAIFSELGRPADALPVAEEAVTICRELAAARPDRYRPDLATSLINLGVFFSALGRPADAQVVTEEAVALYRGLAAASPDRERPDLATSLTNLGAIFSELGRPADALPVTEEAVTIRRELATASPDRYRPHLAQSLTSLGAIFSELGRPADALPIAEEAVAIRRELAAARPDRYRPDLAQSLNNLGAIFSALGRPADALPVAEEAVAVYRGLAAAGPDRYRPDIAASLINLGVFFSALGRPADARVVTEEAVALHRGLAAASPDRYRPDLATSLTNLGVFFSALGHPADALLVAEEAVAIRRELSAASPDRYRPHLAQSLTSLAEALVALDRTAAANAARDEAAQLGQQPDR